MIRMLCAALLLLFSAGCSRNYFIASNFEEITANHKVIAIVPVQMVFTGKRPKDMTDEQLAQLEEGTSKAYMMSLHDQVLTSTRKGKRPIRISLQEPNQTLSLMEQQGIGIRESWTMDTRNLAQVLGVDAVLRLEITTTRYMSDLASFGIQFGQDILRFFTPRGFWSFAGGQARTSDIYANAQLISATEGFVLWSKSTRGSSDWNDPAERVIRNMTSAIARDFPYRLPQK